MTGRKIINLFLFLPLCIFCFSLNNVKAQDSIGFCPISIIPSEVDIRYFIEWENEPPATMNQGTHSDISVKGKSIDAKLNLAWTISGNGFSFDPNDLVQSVETTANQLTLYANSGACGTATINIEDALGNKVTAYVRSNSGIWLVCDEVVGCYTPGMLLNSYSKIVHPFRIRWSENKYWSSACYDVTAECGGFSFNQGPIVWETGGNRCRCIARVAIHEWVCP